MRRARGSALITEAEQGPASIGTHGSWVSGHDMMHGGA